MRFDLNRFFLCDSEEMRVSLTDLLSGKASSGTEFALGGVPDWAAQAEIAYEYAKNLYPEVTVLEVDRSERLIDPLYNEPIAAAETVDRQFTIHALVKYGTALGKYSEKGIEYNSETLIHFPIVGCVMADWSPEAGDKFRHLGRVYGIHSVFVDKDAVYGNTGLPTFLSADASQLRYGDGPAGVVAMRNTRPSKRFTARGPAAQTVPSVLST
jgi:hypothetical protein